MDLACAVDMKGITKTFPGVLANDNVDFDLRVGEIHALLGENGAGKTTLMNVLYGLYRPDTGSISVGGKQAILNSPVDAIKNGIGMVHQQFTLVDVLTVTENIILGQKSDREPFLDFSAAKEKIRQVAQNIGFSIDPDAIIWQLSMGERQRVEIVKALFRGTHVLILDEPTSVLTPNEALSLFEVLRKIASQSYSVILVTHKLHEVMEVSDRITILRDGKAISTVNTAETNQRQLAKMMVGREVVFRLEREHVARGQKVLEVHDLTGVNDKKIPAVKGVSFDVHGGEILGIAGVSGNGQRELAEILTGIRKATGGKVALCGNDITNKPTSMLINSGVGHIPEDRRGRGLVGDFSLAENFILETHADKEFTFAERAPVIGNWFINYEKVNEKASQLIAEYDVRTPGYEVAASKLSGGNQQKLVLARELAREPILLIACQPTVGLDVGATEYLRREVLKQRGMGKAILLISDDLDEILMMSDRIAVIYEGQIKKIIPSEEAKVEEIGLLMGGFE